ncbi:EamA family transporter RarD [Sphingomonas piscis]|uniref:EamA family transporter RarD n=1 Tax=Sphingomonas piscis TaxID=2714943 RepID=A0A6G7YP27_9SPHN|nr:EamA family transporter RarD [Sphingomonas piscis]QIK78489.1 EamA family transporter RarD [Sphingomonas piscis]
MNSPAETNARAVQRKGFLCGLGAYGFWGVLPIYFKQIPGIPPVDVVAHRVLWSVPLLLLILTVTRQLASLRAAFANGRALQFLSATAVLIAINWLLYIYAIVNGHILAGSLGYYLNPLANVLLGRFILKEPLTRLQWAAVALAAAGIAALAVEAIDQLWISLSLCASFATYGLLRKLAPVESAVGLTVETSLLLPLAVGWLSWQAISGQPVFGETTHDTAFLLVAGLVTSLPLLLFTAAARALRYSTLGMLQFLAPTLQFLIAVWIYGEAFTTAHAIAFGAIWIALAIYVSQLLRQSERSPSEA